MTLYIVFQLTDIAPWKMHQATTTNNYPSEIVSVLLFSFPITWLQEVEILLPPTYSAAVRINHPSYLLWPEVQR